MEEAGIKITTNQFALSVNKIEEICHDVTGDSVKRIIVFLGSIMKISYDPVY